MEVEESVSERESDFETEALSEVEAELDCVVVLDGVEDGEVEVD